MTRSQYEVAHDQQPRCEDYIFKSGDYEYIVNYCETQLAGDGYGEHQHYLLIKKDGKTILKQEKKIG